LATSSVPFAVLKARRVTPPTVLRLLAGAVPLPLLLVLPYGSNASDRKLVMTAALPAELSRPGGMGLKLDGDPGALMGAVFTVPGGVTEIAAWMLGVLKVIEAGAALPVPPLAREVSKLLAALDARESSTPVT
jgi:hypothetical protein